MSNDFNQQVIDEFRANAGQVGGYFEGARLILLTTTGARSGVKHTTPVAYLPDGPDRILVIASAGGSPRNPAWFHNLVANPRVSVDNGLFTYDADAVVLHGAERDSVFARAVEADAGWGDYQAKTTRVIPVVALDSVAGPPNFGSVSQTITKVHAVFRRELALIRKEIADSGPGLGAQLRINCLTVCQGLHRHHTGEDMGLFAFVAERYPEAEPIIDRLRQEHVRIAALLAALQEVISTPNSDQQAVLAEVERLADELEHHLAYEEAQLIPILDAITG